MDTVVVAAPISQLAAPIFQAVVVVGLLITFATLYRQHRKPYLAGWAIAWCVYTLRLGAIISFLVTTHPIWLYAHQVATGWTALAFLWAALAFSHQVLWRRYYLALILFPPLWSYVAIYRLDNFGFAAGPAVAFLSVATGWAGWTFWRYHRQVRSPSARFVGWTLLAWSAHHLDYPFLRARGTWNPWGYYLDTAFALAVGVGITLLVLDDIRKGLETLSTLSGDLRPRGNAGDVIRELLDRPLQLPGVEGSAMYIPLPGSDVTGVFVHGAGTCAPWTGSPPEPRTARLIERAIASAGPAIMHANPAGGPTPTGYLAALPIIQEDQVSHVLVMAGETRDPFAALDSRFLDALAHQVGAALHHAALYRKLQARTADLQRLATTMLRQHEEQRRRIARELHDETAQVFSAVKLQLGSLRESSTGPTAERLEHITDLVAAGIRSIRSVTSDLRPSMLDDLGLLPALHALVGDFEERSGIPASLTAPATLPTLSPDHELALFRALQEGLSNAARHAGATGVDVTLACRADRIRLDVADDGCGPPATLDPTALANDGHMGLAGMRERVAALGGQTRLETNRPRGARLRVEIPVEAAA